LPYLFFVLTIEFSKLFVVVIAFYNALLFFLWRSVNFNSGLIPYFFRTSCPQCVFNSENSKWFSHQQRWKIIYRPDLI